MLTSAAGAEASRLALQSVTLDAFANLKKLFSANALVTVIIRRTDGPAGWAVLTDESSTKLAAVEKLVGTWHGE